LFNNAISISEVTYELKRSSRVLLDGIRLNKQQHGTAGVFPNAIFYLLRFYASYSAEMFIVVHRESTQMLGINVCYRQQ
jgi:hypothetical protein